MFCIPEFNPAPAAGSSDCRDLQICLQSFINGERDGGRKFKALLPSELLFVSYASPPPLFSPWPFEGCHFWWFNDERQNGVT